MASQGFPIDVGLVGRLDCGTSGIILFSDDQVLAKGIRDPVDDDSDLILSPYKQKIYDVVLLSSRKYTSICDLDVLLIELELSSPYTFNRGGTEYHTNSYTQVNVTSIYQEKEKYGFGRPDLGWVIGVKVTLNEGKHHQIRRMASLNGYKVISLTRICIANILNIDSIPNPGDCRWLTEGEIEEIYRELRLVKVPASSSETTDAAVIDDDDIECEESTCL